MVGDARRSRVAGSVHVIGHPRAKLERLVLCGDALRAGPVPSRLPDGYERVYCHHIRKTAGTSLARSFLALGGETPETVERRMARAFLRRTTSGGLTFATGLRSTLERGRYFFGWSHVAAHGMSLPAHTFTVTVFRDPVARAISYFRYLMVGDRRDAAFRVSERERDIAYGGFSRFLDVVSDAQLLRQLYTFSAELNPEEAVENVHCCSLVLFTEEFSSGLAKLGKALELPLETRHDRQTGGDDVHPTTTELDQLRTRLDREYRLIDSLRCGRSHTRSGEADHADARPAGTV